MRRKPTYYLFNLVMPCICVSLISILVFSLPPDTGSRISLSITALLSTVVLLHFVANKTPKTDKLPLLGKNYYLYLKLKVILIYKIQNIVTVHYDITRITKRISVPNKYLSHVIWTVIKLFLNRRLLWFSDDIDDTLYSHVYWCLSYLPARYFRRPDAEVDPKTFSKMVGSCRPDEVKCQGRARYG